MKLKKKETNIIRAKHEYKRGNATEKLKEIFFATHESANVSRRGDFT